MEQSIKDFVDTNEFCEGVISSTIAGYSGSGYSVEFFENGKSRVIWNNNIGNLYQSSGIIVQLPQLDTEDIEAPANDKDELREAFVWQQDDLQKAFFASAFERFNG